MYLTNSYKYLLIEKSLFLLSCTNYACDYDKLFHDLI